MGRRGASCGEEGGWRVRDEGPVRRPVRGREGAGRVCVGVSLLGRGTEVELLRFLTCWGRSVDVCLFFSSQYFASCASRALVGRW